MKVEESPVLPCFIHDGRVQVIIPISSQEKLLLVLEDGHEFFAYVIKISKVLPN